MIEDPRADDKPGDTEDPISAGERCEERRGSPPGSAGDDDKALDQMADALMGLLRKVTAEERSFKGVFETLERTVIVKALSARNGHQAKTANFLRLLPTTLSAKMKKHKIVIGYSWTESIANSLEIDVAPASEPEPGEAGDTDPDLGS